MKEIAVIGLGCRFPGGADNPEKYWKVLEEGKDCTREVDEKRWNKDLFYDPNKEVKGKSKVCRAGFLDSIDKFDPTFFGISPKEARYMDPQQRMLLEVVYEAIEDSGMQLETIRGKKVGVYVGAFTLDYKVVAFDPRNIEKVDTYTATGSLMTLLSNRISYIFDFRGPSMTIDTACSSSMVATHTACEAIANGECEMAVVGGSNALISPSYFIAESKGGFLSPDGRCKAFDKSANGYGRGEGVGVVVLKALDKAIEDNNQIYAVIKATGVNQDGMTDGITKPSGEQQKKLLIESLEKAGLAAEEISYVEAHGTGTAVGDPIEANSIGEVIGAGREDGNDCLIGSVKSNLGHLEAASGMASLIKVCLMMQHKKVPASIHFNNPNPKINFKKLHIKVNTELCDFISRTGKLDVAINSFGYGGTNANVIIENYEQVEVPDKESKQKQEWQLAMVSAKNEKALHDNVTRLKEYLSCNDSLNLDNVLHSMMNNRSRMSYTLTFPVNSKELLEEGLSSYLEERKKKNLFAKEAIHRAKRKNVFVYTGMGPIWWAMGRMLYLSEPVFKDKADEIDAIVQKYAGWSIIEKMMATEEESQLDLPKYSQPANFVLQVALTALWNSYGIYADAVVGHSVGEVSVSYVSGALSLEDAVRVSIERSRIHNNMAGLGTMMAAGITQEEALDLIKPYQDKISVGVVNSDDSVTLSGDKEALEELQKELKEKKIFSKFLNVNVAYHSYQMELFEKEFRESFDGITPSESKVPIYSTVEGKCVSGKEYGSQYWWKNVRQTVQFKKAVNQLIDDDYNVFVEIGPHPVLKSYIERCLEIKNKDGEVVTSLRRKENENETFLGAVGYMYALGFDVDKSMLTNQGVYTKLPLYAWQNQSYWNETQEAVEWRTGIDRNYMLGRRLKESSFIWDNDVKAHRYEYLGDHNVDGVNLFPGAGYLEMGLAFMKEYALGEKLKLEDVTFDKAMYLAEDKTNKVQFIFEPKTNEFKINSRYYGSEEPWQLNSHGRVSQSFDTAGPRLDLELIKSMCTHKISKQECYAQFDKQGFQYGDKFQSIEALYIGKDEALYSMKVTDEDFLNEEKYVLHPTLIDACFQGMVSMMSQYDDIRESGRLFLPVKVATCEVFAKPQSEMVAHLQVTVKTNSILMGDIRLCDKEGNVVAKIYGFQVQDAGNSNLQKVSGQQTLYNYQWIEQEEAAEKGYIARELEEEERFQFKKKGTWLLFSAKNKLSNDLKTVLEEKEQKIFFVTAGEKFEKNENMFTLNVDQAEDYRALIKELKASGDKLSGILHLWNLEGKTSKQSEAKYLKDFQSIGSMSVINMLKACELEEVIAPLYLVTRGVQKVEKEDEVALAQAPVWGVGRVFGYQEYPEMFGALIDLDGKPSESDVSNIMSVILRSDNDNQVAFRKDKKYVSRVVPVEKNMNSIHIKFQEDKTYVITGAFGALGMLVAKWMCQNGVRSIILLGRTNFPERTEWNKEDKDSKLGRRIAFIKELEKLGAHVHVFSANIEKYDEIEKCFDGFKAEGWPEIAGVIHTAGVVKDTLISNMDKKTFDMVLAPKICGSWNLHKYFENNELDFMIFFSSVSSTINVTMGQSNYAAANMFMDSLAKYRRSRNMNTVSINWGPWADVGMATEGNLIDYYESRGISPIRPNQGLTTLERVLRYEEPQVLVLTANWNMMKNFFQTNKVPPMMYYLCEQAASQGEEENGNSGSNIYGTILSISDEAERRKYILEQLTIVLAKAFGTIPESISSKQYLSELGMDSLMAIDIQREIESVFQNKVSIVELMRGITIEELAGKLFDMILHKNDGTFSSEGTYEMIEPDLENENELFPVTDIQMAYLTGRNETFVLGGVSTHIYMEIESKVDLDKFEKAFNHVIRMNPMLRCVFNEEGKQRIREKVPEYKIRCKDVSMYAKDTVMDEVLKYRRKLSHKMFNPEVWPLFNISALKVGEETTRLYIGFDMIIADGVSWKMIGDAISRAYYSGMSEDEKIDFTFRDYIRGYHNIRNTQVYKEDKKYWMDKIENFAEYPKIPFKCAVTDITAPHFTRLSTILEIEECQKLKELAKEKNISLSVLFCTAYAMVLSRWSSQKEIAINATTFSRYPLNKDVNRIIGDFTTLMFLEIDLSDADSFWEMAQKVQLVMMEALDHKHYDGVELARELMKKNGSDLVMPVVFTSMLSDDGNDMSGWGSFGKIDYAVSQTPQVILDNQLIDLGDRINVVIDYVDNLFYQEDVENLYGKYIEIIKSVAAEKEITAVPEVEEDISLIERYNDTADATFEYATLHELFKKQAGMHPENIAVKHGTQTITYRELDEQSDCVACYLKEEKVKAGDCIGVVGNREISTVVNILGILKCGAAYIPIHPQWPEERVKYITDNCSCNIVLNEAVYQEKKLNQYKEHGFEADQDIKRIAYIIYTSGSTGTPKGVIISHKEAVNTILDINKRYSLSGKDQLIGISEYNFDLSVYDLFGSLSTGATLNIPNNVRDIEELVQIMEDDRITIWNSVPAIMELVTDNIDASKVYPDLRLVLLSGDWIPLGLFDKIKKVFPNAEVISLGGATEGSIWSICYPIEKVEKSWHSIPYGYPLANQQMYILNHKLELCPANVTGEICIGGTGVAEGYANEKEKTDAVFVNHPVLGRIYKTGDYGVLRREGYIEFLGRKDNQVKIRGNRIEIGEIEHCLSELKAVEKAVVVDLKDKKDNKFLCAYVVSKEELNPAELKEELAKKLPSYMIPMMYLKVDEIPLSANGKVDRRRLPMPEENGNSTIYVKPANEEEEKIEQICREVLSIDSPISMLENLYDLGWDSIKMINLIFRIKAEYGVKIPISVLVQNSTIAGMAQYLQENMGEESAFTIFNKGAKKRLYAFPSIFTYSVTYFELSRYLEDYEIYSLDYIESETLVKDYADQILRSQNDGEFNFIGFSSGGFIAFEVAKELEARNCKVGNIIMLDSYYGVNELLPTMPEEMSRQFKQNVIASFSENLLMENMEELPGRIDSYLDFLKNQETKGVVAANMYLLNAEKADFDFGIDFKERNKGFASLTTGEFRTYDAYGSHTDLILGENIKKNEKLINKILKEVF